MISLFVETFIKKYNLEKVDVIQNYIDLPNFSKGINIGANTICFVHRFQAIGEMSYHGDLAKNLLVLESFNQRVDYSKIFKFESYGNLQVLTSDLITMHRDNVVITLDTTNPIFSNLIKCSVEYTLIRGIEKPITVNQKVVEINIQE